ncbi:hypothetical protein LBMAG38_10060 [Chloroflexota bacterium]|nr:hypothetical protein LBMAG38_10060 [Chloroflexota bacterium]
MAWPLSFLGVVWSRRPWRTPVRRSVRAVTGHCGHSVQLRQLRVWSPPNYRYLAIKHESAASAQPKTGVIVVL